VRLFNNCNYVVILFKSIPFSCRVFLQLERYDIQGLVIYHINS